MGNTELQIKLEPLTDHEIKHSKDLFLSSYHTFDFKPSGSSSHDFLQQNILQAIDTHNNYLRDFNKDQGAYDSDLKYGFRRVLSGCLTLKREYKNKYIKDIEKVVNTYLDFIVSNHCFFPVLTELYAFRAFGGRVGA